MENNTFGYARVSSRDQNEERQVIALLEMGVPEQNIYVDKQSGKDFNRPQYKKMLRRVKPDDLIYIKNFEYGDLGVVAKWIYACYGIFKTCVHL